MTLPGSKTTHLEVVGMPLVVTRTRTPIAQSALPGLISEAFAAENIPLPGISRMMLAVLVSIETARGASVMNHNLGNITAGPQFPGAVWRPPWFDPAEAQASPRLQRLHQEMLAGRAPSAFRAYPTREEGARDFARTLKRNFPEVLRAATVASAENFRDALSQKYSRDFARPGVAESLAKLMREFGITTGAGIGAVSGVAAFVLLFLAWKLLRTS